MSREREASQRPGAAPAAPHCTCDRFWSAHAVREENPSGAEGFAAWREREFEICDTRLKGKEAAYQVLLPIAAVSLGMAVFALVLHFDIGA